jgi:hypothetical protein
MVRGARLMALVCLWLAPLLILYTALASDWVSTWEAFAVPSMNPPFMDLCAITNGVKVQQEGGDPLINNPADPWHRALPYPRIWVHLFSWLGVRESQTTSLGIVFCVLYLICISWLLLKCESSLGSIILVIAALSIAPLLAIERGNIDLFIFFLLFFGCTANNKFLRSGVFFVATVLKIYPIAAQTVDAIRRPLKENRVAIAAMVAGAAFWAWKWRELGAIRHAAMAITTTLTFGMFTLKTHAEYLSGALLAFSVAACVMILGIAWANRPSPDKAILNSKFGEMFLIFTGIYVFTFVVGSNYNYRLIFLIPTLPVACELVLGTKHRKWGIIYIACVLASENSVALGLYQGIPLEDFATFTLFAMILPILLQQAGAFFMNTAALFPPSANIAGSHDKVIG